MGTRVDLRLIVPGGRALVASLLTALAPVASAESQCPVAGQGNPRPTPGDYLATSYTTVLQRTLSPTDAERTTTAPFAHVERTPEGLRLSVGTFDQADGEILLADGGEARRPGGSSEPCGVALKDALRFSARLDSSDATTEYTFVGNLEDWAADLLFVGTYEDRDGLRHIFERHGKAIFGGVAVTYSISESDRDGFEAGIVVIDGQRYSFERSRKKLTIRGPLTDDEASRDKPAWVLKCVSR